MQNDMYMGGVISCITVVFDFFAFDYIDVSIYRRLLPLLRRNFSCFGGWCGGKAALYEAAIYRYRVCISSFGEWFRQPCLR